MRNGFKQEEWVHIQEKLKGTGDHPSGGQTRTTAVALNTMPLGFTQMVLLATTMERIRGVIMETAITHFQMSTGVDHPGEGKRTSHTTEGRERSRKVDAKWTSDRAVVLVLPQMLESWVLTLLHPGLCLQ